MHDIITHQITLKEITMLQNIGKQTFFETFSDTNTADDMNKYLNDNFSPDQLTKELNNPHSAFYFATINNETVGYLKVNWSKAQTEQHDDEHGKRALEVERIYVLQQYHGKKIGQILYDKALEIAQQKNSNYLWLGVWEHNHRAIRFYEKNGFIAFDKHIFTVGTDEQTDIMMKLKL